ncbi:hypothetical protein AVEN_100917-1 [Araneus ventricosus]|uniref:Uncharacterized protein n=1 Tax=Araneus ventricosus TaxID=182803 RepID=A0A4Y2AX04_ARAVE|nr:hypothetical protein AVEN_100917-1 [Araneus ventricosus]
MDQISFKGNPLAEHLIKRKAPSIRSPRAARRQACPRKPDGRRRDYVKALRPSSDVKGLTPLGLADLAKCHESRIHDEGEMWHLLLSRTFTSQINWIFWNTRWRKPSKSMEISQMACDGWNSVWTKIGA